MWHEARRQEKKIRSLMVDYQRRADRRRQFYEKIKMDPAQFLRLYGRPTKIHLDPAVAMAAESPQSMMSWQGSPDIILDRFDVRAHLDYIPEVKSTELTLNPEEDDEERKCNYERYRILVQNDCAGVQEEQNLQQIYIDEMYGAIDLKAKEQEKLEEKKKLASKKAAIGFVYDKEDDEEEEEKKEETEDSSEDSDDDMDLDAVFDYNKLTPEQIHSFNMCAMSYGMKGNDYVNNLRLDKMEADEVRMAKLLEEEKAQFSGRKSRRERRAFKEKRLKQRPLLGGGSPPSYATLDEGEEKAKESSSSRSRSRSPEAKTQPVFITSFGGSDDEEVVQGPTLPPHLQARNFKPSSARMSRAESPKFTEIAPGSKSFRARQSRRSPSYSPPRARREQRYSPRRSSYRYHDNRSHFASSRYDNRSRRRSGSRDRRRSRSPRRSGSPRRSRSPRHWGGRGSSYNSRRSRSPWRPSRQNESSQYRRRSPEMPAGRDSTRTRSRSGSKPKTRSKSKSPITEVTQPSQPPTQPPHVFRRRSLSKSSSEDDEFEELKKTEEKQSSVRSSVGSKDKNAPSKGVSIIQERMRRKMQKALNQQYKADKKALEEKQRKEELERMEREEELKAITLEMRRKEREKRHRERAELDRIGRRPHNDAESGSDASYSSSEEDGHEEEMTCGPPPRSMSNSPHDDNGYQPDQMDAEAHPVTNYEDEHYY